MAKLVKNGKVSFNKSGSGSVSGRVTIPQEILQLMDIREDDRDIIITYKDGDLIIQKNPKDIFI